MFKTEAKAEKFQTEEIRSSYNGMTQRRAWQSTPVFLPGESHGQRSLVGYGYDHIAIVHGYDHKDQT